MPVTFRFDDSKGGASTFKTGVKRFGERQIRAQQSAARAASSEIESLGRKNIAAGGNFKSERWQQGFRALVSFASRSDILIRVTHAVRYWIVFEEGRVIRGRPLLWIPLRGTQAEQLGVRAREFPGKLFRVNRVGKAPLLMNSDGPQYFGKESVRIPKKWHLRSIVKQTSRKMGQFYREAMRSGR